MGWVSTWWDSRAVSEEEQLSICGHVCGCVCVRVCVRVHVCMLLHGSLPPLPSSVFCVWLCYLSPHQLWMAGEASGQEYVLTTVFCIGNRQNVAGRRPWGERCWSRQETGGKEKRLKRERRGKRPSALGDVSGGRGAYEVDFRVGLLAWKWCSLLPDSPLKATCLFSYLLLTAPHHYHHFFFSFWLTSCWLPYIKEKKANHSFHYFLLPVSVLWSCMVITLNCKEWVTSFPPPGRDIRRGLLGRG